MHDLKRRTRLFQDLQSTLAMAQVQADELEEMRIAALIAMVSDAVADRIACLAGGRPKWGI